MGPNDAFVERKTQSITLIQDQQLLSGVNDNTYGSIPAASGISPYQFHLCNSTMAHNCSSQPDAAVNAPSSSSPRAPENFCTPEEESEEALKYMVAIPDVEKNGFNFRKLWAFTGPGFLMSIAYLDPGNIESDLKVGAIARYKLMWVLFTAHILGFLLQRLSARIGVVSGKHMAEIAYEFYPTFSRLVLWIMIEIAIIVSDMQEVIGTAIAFYLISNRHIQLFVGVLITMADTFTFLLIDRYGFRKLEVLFAFLIGTMAVAFGYEFIRVKPDGLDIIKGTVLPWCANCGQAQFLQAIGIVGAVIMPHNLYLHSALVKSRRIDRSNSRAVTDANFYYLIESGIALMCSFIINLFVVSVFAHGFYDKTNRDMIDLCSNQTGILNITIPDNYEPLDIDIYRGGVFLGCAFGLPALYVWAVGVMAAGQSSTMTGTYAGQFVMEGFLHIRWPRWLRVFVTRAIAIVPTLMVTLSANGVDNLTGMNDFLNRAQMIQLPFALLPVITFTAHRKIMFEYKSTKGFQIFALTISIIVIGINMYYIFDGIAEQTWYVLAPTVIGMPIYIAFVIYLLYICLQSMEVFGEPDSNGSSCLKWIQPRVDRLTIRPLWQQQYEPNSVTTDNQKNSARDDRNRQEVEGGVDNSAFDVSSTALHQRGAAQN